MKLLTLRACDVERLDFGIIFEVTIALFVRVSHLYDSFLLFLSLCVCEEGSYSKSKLGTGVPNSLAGMGLWRGLRLSKAFLGSNTWKCRLAKCAPLVTQLLPTCKEIVFSLNICSRVVINNLRLAFVFQAILEENSWKTQNFKKDVNPVQLEQNTKCCLASLNI